jgi:hypothetical protein
MILQLRNHGLFEAEPDAPEFNSTHAKLKTS